MFTKPAHGRSRGWRNEDLQEIPAWPAASNSPFITDHTMDLSTRLHDRRFLNNYLPHTPMWTHGPVCLGDGEGGLPGAGPAPRPWVLIYAERHNSSFMSQGDPLRAMALDLSGLFKNTNHPQVPDHQL